MSEAHVHVDPSNKKVALFIAVLALVLAFAETLGKGSQTSALASHIEASNLWAFFQAKTIRQTTVRAAAEEMEAQFGNRAPEAVEKQRDRAMAAYHNYEIASAAVQIAIVLASAQIITGVAALLWIAYALGAIGVAFSLIGFFWPTAAHLF